MAQWLVTVPFDELLLWIQQDANPAELLPQGAKIPLGYVSRKVFIASAKSFGPGSWKHILKLLDLYAQKAKATGDPNQMEPAADLTKRVALLIGGYPRAGISPDAANRWYYRSMTRFRDAVVSRLETDDRKGGSGASPAESEPGPEEEEAPEKV